MAGVWCLHRDRRKDGYRNYCDPKVFYLYFFPHARFSYYILFVYGLLDEH
jgi:hypothetical protein